MYTNVEWFSQGYNMSENIMLNISCNSVQKKASVNNLKSSNRLWNNRNQPRYNIRRLHIPNKATNSLIENQIRSIVEYIQVRQVE